MVVDCIWNDFRYVFMICFESIHNLLFRLKGFIVPLNRPAVSLAFSILASSISSDSEAINQAQLSIPTSIGGRSSNDCVFSFAHTIYLTHILPGLLVGPVAIRSGPKLIFQSTRGKVLANKL